MVLNLLVDVIGVHVAESVEMNNSGMPKYGRQELDDAGLSSAQESGLPAKELLYLYVIRIVIVMMVCQR